MERRRRRRQRTRNASDDNNTALLAVARSAFMSIECVVCGICACSREHVGWLLVCVVSSRHLWLPKWPRAALCAAARAHRDLTTDARFRTALDVARGVSGVIMGSFALHCRMAALGMATGWAPNDVDIFLYEPAHAASHRILRWLDHMHLAVRTPLNSAQVVLVMDVSQKRPRDDEEDVEEHRDIIRDNVAIFNRLISTGRCMSTNHLAHTVMGRILNTAYDVRYEKTVLDFDITGCLIDSPVKFISFINDPRGSWQNTIDMFDLSVCKVAMYTNGTYYQTNECYEEMERGKFHIARRTATTGDRIRKYKERGFVLW